MPTGFGSFIFTALIIQRYGCSWQFVVSRKGEVIVPCWRVVQTLTCAGLEKIFDLFDGTIGPLLSSGGVAEVGHDVSSGPGAGLGSWTPEIGRRLVSVMDSAKEVANLMSSHLNARVASRVFHQRHTADLLQVSISNTSSTNVSVTSVGSAHLSILHPCHVQTSQCHHHVIHWQIGSVFVIVLSHGVKSCWSIKHITIPDA